MTGAQIFVSRFRDSGKLQLLNVNDALSRDDENLDIRTSPDDLVAIRYTSGSTGEPKGVVETQRNAFKSFVMNVREKQISSSDRLSLLHSLGFASAYVNFYSALLSSASLFPFNPKAESVFSLVKWIRSEEITVLHFPVSLFRQLADAGASQQHTRSVRLIQLSGAAITLADFELYKNIFPPHASLAVSMGSTETRGDRLRDCRSNFFISKRRIAGWLSSVRKTNTSS